MADVIPGVTAAAVSDDDYLLDVREPDEWAAGHAPGAHHLPMWEVPARLAEVPRDRPVVVVCRSGNRSGQVIAYLQGHGFTPLRNLDGGMHAKAHEQRPMVSDDGRPAQVI